MVSLRPTALAPALIAVLVVATRWPFRSEALFSWDSANFAFALRGIDLAQHRPHPPGYLGYVFVARAIEWVVQDANTAFVIWNMIATALAVCLVLVFAWEVADRDPATRRLTAIAAATATLTSPLIWFYGEVAEIYPSELLFATLVAYTGWRTIRGAHRWIYACVALLAVTALFKIVTALLLLPLAAHAWLRVPTAARRRSAAAAAGAGVAVIVTFAVVQPQLFAVAAQVFWASDWVVWFLKTDARSVFEVINRNARNTLTAAIAGMGVVNVLILLYWVLRDRRLPEGLTRRFAWLWAAPVLALCVVWVIGKPGYILPLMPLTAIIAGAACARMQPGLAMSVLAAQVVVNTAQFTLLSPLPASATGGSARYAEKPWWQKVLSDVQPVTFPTVFTIEQSDERVRQLRDVVEQSCPAGNPVVVADLQPVDWRRVMWYFPRATAVHLSAAGVDYIGKEGRFEPVTAPDEIQVQTSCPVLWLAPDPSENGRIRPTPQATTVPHLGWTTPAGTVRVTRVGIIAHDDTGSRPLYR